MRLYIDPFRNKFKDCQMLRSNVGGTAQILEIMPVVFTHENITYRRSHFAIDFCFCMPCISSCFEKNFLDRCSCVECHFNNQDAKTFNFEDYLATLDCKD